MFQILVFSFMWIKQFCRSAPNVLDGRRDVPETSVRVNTGRHAAEFRCDTLGRHAGAKQGSQKRV
jgi:hypothetical protein